MTERYPFRDDYISTSEIGRRLGFPISGRFIEGTLGVPATFHTAAGFYWSPEHLQKVYAALVEHIHAEAVRSAPEAP